MSIDFLAYYIAKIDESIESELPLTDLVLEIEKNLPSEQVAHLLEAFPLLSRLTIWDALEPEFQQDVFLEMRNESRILLLNALDDELCFPLFEKLDATSLLDLSESLSDRFIDYAVTKMTAIQRKYFKSAQEYSVDELGHWQSFDDLHLSQNFKVSAAKKLCGKHLPLLTEVIYVTNAEAKLVGEISINQLFKYENSQLLSEIITTSSDQLLSTLDVDIASDNLITSGKSALPVVDENGCLTGRLDIHSAYRFKGQQKESQFMQAGGLIEEEDLFSSVWVSSKNRAVWLGINLLTAFLASWFIGLFEATLQQVVALAVLMPVVASMGGISGSQTLTLIIRGLALGQITEANKQAIIKKELKVGLINGILWAMVISLITYLWFDTPMLSLTICIAILGNIIIASLSGVWVPWMLNKFNIDPALSGAVILTTVTDIFGFIAFLGCGTLFLL